MSRSGEPGTVVFALGANLGDRMGALGRAARTLARSLAHVRASAVYVTPPEGGADQPEYLNAVVAGEASLRPAEALALALGVEVGEGRTRPAPGAPRTLDVDVLFVGDEVRDEPGLRIPHPRWRSRDFVVVPLLDVVPDLVDPESGSTVREVAQARGWDTTRFPIVAEPGSLLREETR